MKRFLVLLLPVALMSATAESRGSPTAGVTAPDSLGGHCHGARAGAALLQDDGGHCKGARGGAAILADDTGGHCHGVRGGLTLADNAD